MSGTVVPNGPWAGPLNWGLYATYYGDTHVPFARHVRLEPMGHPPSNFLLFQSLPVEVQLHILRFCDSATLFWLMQVCCAIRREASKLFWSDPSVWYIIDGSWLLAGGFAGHAHYDINALGCMRRIVVDFAELQPLHAQVWDDGVCNGVVEFTEEDVMRRIHDFWQTLQGRFPCATHVVLSEAFALPHGSSLPLGQKRMAEACPKSVSVYVSFLAREKGTEERLKRSLWQCVRNSHDPASADWEQVTTRSWIQQGVSPPPKQFHGPVGTYSRYRFLERCSHYQQRARRLLVLQAVEAYYLQHKDFAFICPTAGCNVQFRSPGQWTAHAIEDRHDVDILLPSEHLRTLFAQHDTRLALLKTQVREILVAMQVAWGNQGSQQRQQAQQDFLSQLQQDPLYTHQRPADQSTIWRHYQLDMEGEVYYG
jgi:hypothetical protein